MKNSYKATQQSKPWRHPREQHPVNRRACERRAYPNADYWMRDNLTQREHESLNGRVLRCVRWLLNDVEALEMPPHRVRRICQPPMREGIGGEKVAELVMRYRLGQASRERQCHAQNKCSEHEQCHR